MKTLGAAWDEVPPNIQKVIVWALVLWYLGEGLSGQQNRERCGTGDHRAFHCRSLLQPPPEALAIGFRE